MISDAFLNKIEKLALTTSGPGSNHTDIHLHHFPSKLETW
jgi:hypothetical protein